MLLNSLYLKSTLPLPCTVFSNRPRPTQRFDTAPSPYASPMAMRLCIFQCGLLCVEIDTFPTVCHTTSPQAWEFCGNGNACYIDEHSLLCTHSSSLAPKLKPPNLESNLAHVDIHAGWGDHGTLYYSGQVSMRVFHRTILSHDPMTGVSMATVQMRGLESHVCACRPTKAWERRASAY